MLARIRKAVDEREEGFTLIELLVVMIIIGILAAIAIPVFLSQRAKAQDSAAKADVSTIGKEVASYYVDNTAAPSIAAAGTRWQLTPAGVGATAQDVGAVSKNVELKGTPVFTSSSDWCVGVTNPEGSKKDFKYSAQSGLEQGTCAAPAAPAAPAVP